MAEDRVTLDELVVRKLDGPPQPGFDCGSPEQNAYLYDHAWRDQQEMVSVTYCYYVQGILAAYVSVLMDGLSLAFRERGIRIRYETVGATKLAQLGVDTRFQGRRLGARILADVVALAEHSSNQLGCRYVSVDARPGLEAWYEQRFFTKNKLMQERRRRFALEKQRDPDRLATSMRLDIRDWIASQHSPDPVSFPR